LILKESLYQISKRLILYYSVKEKKKKNSHELFLVPCHLYLFTEVGSPSGRHIEEEKKKDTVFKREI